VIINIPELAELRFEHTSRIQALSRMLNDPETVIPADTISKYASGIGPWIYGFGLVKHAEIKEIESAEQIHSQLYKHIFDLVECVKHANLMQAFDVFDKITTLDERLSELLDQIEKQIGIPGSGGKARNQQEIQSDLRDEYHIGIYALTETSDMLILFSDSDGDIFYVNKEWIRVTGRKCDAIKEQGWSDLVCEHDYRMASETIILTMQDKVQRSCGLRMSGNTFEERYFLLKAVPWFQNDGLFGGLIITLTDVDAIYRVIPEERIKNVVLDRCELIIGICDIDDQLKSIYNNPYTLQKLGWDSAEGKMLMDAVYPDDRTKVASLLPDMIARKGGSHEIRLYNQLTGEPFWVQWNVMVIEEPGLPAILATISPDITQRKQYQEMLEQREGALMNAIEIAQLGTWEMDVATYKTHFSQRHLEMFGVSGNSMTIEDAISHVVGQDRQQLSSAFFDAQKTGGDGKFEAEYTIINAATGKEHIIHSLGQTYFDVNGKAIRIAGIAQDITIYRDLQRSLEIQVLDRTRELDESNKKLAEGHHKMEQANLLLSRSNEDLQRFAYVASHDLQEPLRKIQQFSGRLQLEFVSASAREKDFLQRLSTAAGRMSTLIEDLLIFSKVSNDAHKARVVSLNKVVDQVVADLDIRIADTGAGIIVDELPSVQGNPVQLGQLFQNLISNALKFHRTDDLGNPITPQIRIMSKLVHVNDLKLRIKPERPASYYHQISVQDNGIGFDEMYLDRIFQVFQRLHGKSEFSGTGIGLAICERVVSNHGGIIDAESQPGQGATFNIYLPAE